MVVVRSRARILRNENRGELRKTNREAVIGIEELLRIIEKYKRAREERSRRRSIQELKEVVSLNMETAIELFEKGDEIMRDTILKSLKEAGRKEVKKLMEEFIKSSLERKVLLLQMLAHVNEEELIKYVEEEEKEGREERIISNALFLVLRKKGQSEKAVSYALHKFMEEKFRKQAFEVLLNMPNSSGRRVLLSMVDRLSDEERKALISTIVRGKDEWSWDVWEKQIKYDLPLRKEIIKELGKALGLF